MIDPGHPRLSELAEIARRAMLDHGLDPDLPPAVLEAVAAIPGPATDADPAIRDLRALPWCSIDDDDSEDLDQLTVARAEDDGAVTVLVAIADVDALVPAGSVVDRHAQVNTLTVYTPAIIFPMLPLRLSTDLTSLDPGQDRLAIVIEMGMGGDGEVSRSDVYRAWVHNHAKLGYPGVAAWLEDGAPMPDAMAHVPGLDQQLRLQDAVAQQLCTRRHQRGALDIRTVEARPVVEDGTVVGLEAVPKSRSRQLIEDFMIAANGVTAAFLQERGFPSIRRVVKAPANWERIRKIAADAGEQLPDQPNAVALGEFMARQQAAEPLTYPDLSLSIVKLMGSGDYAVERPGDPPGGHFGLAVRDYGHATAPNRRYPDILTQRLLKAALAGGPVPYAVEELERLAAHCTRQEDQARRVERQARKAASSAYLGGHIGDRFNALVTGVTDKGVWVRTLEPPVEGKLVAGEEGLDVGDHISVRLESVDPLRGFVDFVRATNGRTGA
ncbi:MAG: RNB domain-containing ribonuclease [Chloroflexi bacterium]|nr:RNB domain-containing ribonuclease [Chloroflexota bacterium]